MELLLVALKSLSVLLIGIGILFVFIDVRTGFDRIFRYFGVSLILVAAMAAIDLYSGATEIPLGQKLFWQKILHGMACLFFPFLATYLMLITGRRIRWAKAALTGIGFGFGLLLPTDLILVARDGAVKGGPLYLPLFFPYAIFYVIFSYYMLFLNLVQSSPEARRFAIIHLSAFVLLTFSGILDMVGVADPEWKAFVSYKIFGILLFGIMSAYVFTERLFLLIRERKANAESIEALRKQMEAAFPLRSLGESSARIAHEIRNYLAVMKANGRLIKMKGWDESSHEIDRIVRSTDRLEELTSSMLEFVKSADPEPPGVFDPAEAIGDCVREHFGDREIAIDGSGTGPLRVRGDTFRMCQVFRNLFRNAFEAGAKTVTVRIFNGKNPCRVEIADDGPGCPADSLAFLGKPFFSTKRNSGGTGLGIAISRSIIESAGGRLIFRNKSEGEGRGLVSILELPLAEPENPEPKNPKDRKNRFDAGPGIIRRELGLHTQVLGRNAEADFPPAGNI